MESSKFYGGGSGFGQDEAGGRGGGGGEASGGREERREKMPEGAISKRGRKMASVCLPEGDLFFSDPTHSLSEINTLLNFPEAAAGRGKNGGLPLDFFPLA